MCSFTVSPLFFQVTSFISLGLEKIIKYNWLWWDLIEQLTTLRKTLRPYLYSQDLMIPESDDVNSLCSQGPIPWRSHVPCVLCSQGLTVCSKELFLPRSFVSCFLCPRGPMFQKSDVPGLLWPYIFKVLCFHGPMFPRSYIMFQGAFLPKVIFS